ncbi:MAG: S8 family serine peptidase [Ignavibacteria bacterium]|nr:S8 family serine peptidase [Ignavibacteria bacterium]
MTISLQRWITGFLFLGVVLATPDVQAGNAKIASDLQTYMAGRSAESIRGLVVMKDRVNTKALEAMSPYRSVRHELVVTSLQDVAERSQAGLLRYLEERTATNEVQRYRSFWITNLVAVEALPSVINEIANRQEVEMIYLDYPVEMIEPVGSSEAPLESPGAAEPGLRDINANMLWDIGIDGSGVIVMNIDTGVDGNHPSLAARWRGLEPGVDPSEAWYNADNPGQTFPADFGYHGTHTMGTLTGLDPNTADTIGVAVGAQWIAAAWDYSTLNKFISDVIDEFNWGADPDGDPGTTDDVPAVISNSWGVGVLFGQPPCDASFWDAIDNAEAAGAAVVFAAGNEGPGAQSLRAPADRNSTPTTTFSVGALNAGSATIASFSSRGPTACAGTTEEKIKPEVCARGVSVRSARPASWGGGYWNLDGTSMACPHVAGGLALLRDAYPDATVDELKYALMNTAVDLGTAGEDNTYGHGRIDLWAAYNELAGSGSGTTMACGDISQYGARCNSTGTVQSIVKVQAGDFGDDVLTWLVDGEPVEVTVISDGSRSIARMSVPHAGVGSHTVELIDPAGCYPEETVVCAVDAAPDPEWDALWNEYQAMAQANEERALPTEAKIMGNYPNPFNPSTTITYSVATEGLVSLRIYNTLGEEVATLVNEFQAPGVKSAVWNGRNNAGSTVASGLYFYRLTAGNDVRMEKMMFMK